VAGIDPNERIVKLMLGGRFGVEEANRFLNSRAAHVAEIPSANEIGNARSLARMHASTNLGDYPLLNVHHPRGTEPSRFWPGFSCLCQSGLAGYDYGTASRLFRLIRMFGAATGAVIVCGIAIMVLGGLLPIWIMILISGRQAVQDAPAHGGMILLLTIPLASLLALLAVIPTAMFFYRKLSS
jgi:hypothetical protein